MFFPLFPCSLGEPWNKSELKPGIQQIVLFTRGSWDECASVSLELSDNMDKLITLGKLTPFNK